MLGSASDAEEAVQESSLRFARAAVAVRDVSVWLLRTVSRLCVDELRSARARRERYVRPRLPEPVLTGEGAAQDPPAQVERREVLSLGALRLLERLTPAEHAVFVRRSACRTQRSPPPSVSATPVPGSIWPGLGATLPPSRHSRRSRQRSTGAWSPPCGQRSRPATRER